MTETTQHGDWNDLARLVGREAARRQLLDAYAAAAPANESPEESPVPSGEPAALAAPDLDQALQRFAWTVPDGKIWDAAHSRIMSQQVCRTWLGKVVFNGWKDHPERRAVAHADVAPLAARAAEADKLAEKDAARSARTEAAQNGGGGVLGEALGRYVLLYPSQSVWDRERREVVALNDLKPKLAGWYTDWLEHPMRQELDRDRLVFDPQGRYREDDGYINMFRGLPLSPRHDPDRCANIRELIRHLCNFDDRVYQWLMCWLAFPMQQVGTKLASAVLMHSETHGTGKSLLFEEVIKPVYGEYAATLGQHQLESQYTDWRSQKLFGLFEEVFSRDQKYSHTGTLKHMITGATHRIEKKFVSGWEEANHMNAVFLSNEIQPFPVEPSDRRLLVIWPRIKLGEKLKQGVLREIENGGVEAFYGYLMALPLVVQEETENGLEYVPFGHHSEPPITVAKRRLIDFGRPSWDTFHRKWQDGELDVPYQSCLTDDLHTVYKRWCQRRSEHVISQTKFSTMLATREDKVAGVRWRVPPSGAKKGTFFIVGGPNEGETQEEWLGRCVAEFQTSMRVSHDPEA
jgi:putative DNA primase/helicase